MMMIQEGRSLSLAAVLVALFMTSEVSAQQPQTTMTGELVETYCWGMLRVGGPAHAACGIECAKRGIPVAIVEAKTRKVFVLLPGRDKKSLPPELIAAMGQKVTVRGESFARGGSQFLTVRSWQRTK